MLAAERAKEAEEQKNNGYIGQFRRCDDVIWAAAKTFIYYLIKIKNQMSPRFCLPLKEEEEEDK